MLILAEAIALGGKLRKESRGSHYRTDYTERDDANYWKASIAKFNGTGSDVEFSEVKAGLVEPRARTYGATDTKKEEKPSGKTEATAAS